MKTKGIKRFFSMFAFVGLAALCLLLTSCGKEKEDKVSWDSATKENTVELALDVTAENSKRVLTITSEEAIFSENIQKDYLEVSALIRKTEEESSEDGDSLEDVTITEYALQRVDDKTVKLSMEAETFYYMLYVNVNSKALTNGKFAEACWVSQSVIDSLEYNATITDDFAGGEFDPVIHITLQNTSLVSGITPEMITLNGAFKNLDILSVNGTGTNLVLTTSGRVTNDSYGIVHISKDALDCGIDLSTSKGILPSSAVLDETSISYKDGKVFFTVKLNNQKFTTDNIEQLSNDIYGSSAELTIEALEEDKVVLSASTTKATLEEAIVELRGLEFYISGARVSTGNNLKFIFSPHQAKIDLIIDTMEEKNDTYTGKAVLNVLYGTLDDLTKDDLTFTEDFKGMTVTSLTKKDFYYELEFNFTPNQTDFDADDCYLAGEVQIPAEKIHTLWNTTGNNTCGVEYINNDEMTKDYDDVMDSIDGFIKKRVSGFINLAKAYDKGGVFGTIDGVLAVLSIMKVMHASEGSKEDSIKSSISKLDKEVAKLSAKMDQQNIVVRNSLNLIRSKVDESTYNNVCFYWNDYMTRYVGGLQKVMDDYTEIYRMAIVKFMQDPENTEVKIYIDVNGNICIPGVSGKYSLDGVAIKEVYTCVGDVDDVNSIIDKVLSPEKKTLTSDYDKALRNAFLDPNVAFLVDAETELPLIGLSGEAQLYAFLAYFSKIALDEVGPYTIINAFTAFCYRLGGGSDNKPVMSAGRTYLDYFYQMLMLFYNFYSEAMVDATTMKNWLRAVETEAYALALYAQDYTSYETVVLDASDAFEKTLDQALLGSSGIRVVTEDVCYFGYFRYYYTYNYDYSYVADRDIVVSYTDAELHYSNFSNIYTPIQTKCERYSGADFKTILSTEDRMAYYVFDDVNSKIKLQLVADDIIKPMYYRYKNMKSCNATKAENFVDYLSDVGLLDPVARRYDRILLKDVEKKSFKADGSMTIMCRSKTYTKSTYFTVGQREVIQPTSDASAKYFTDMIYYQAEFFDTDTGEIKTKKTYARAEYIERHKYWITPEVFLFWDVYEAGAVLMYTPKDK